MAKADDERARAALHEAEKTEEEAEARAAAARLQAMQTELHSAKVCLVGICPYHRVIYF